MTTSAMTWFYNPPENIPYFISERVNTTLWDERLGGVWLTVVRAEAPFEMTGTYNGATVNMTWQPAEWLRLTTCPEAPALMKGLANVLRRQPSLRYETLDGETVWEWWIEGVDRRWQEIQGRPAYGRPARLDKAN
jgi:hypothetical protein